MADITSFTKYVTNYVPGLPTFVFARAFLSASREYFKQTQSWRETLTIPVKALGNDVDLFKFTPGSDVESIIHVRAGDKELIPIQHLPVGNEVGSPECFYASTKRELILYPSPENELTLDVLVTLTPKVGTETFPEHLFSEHFEGLIAGTIANLKRMTGKDWFDPNGAAEHYSEFQRHIDTKRLENAHQHSNSDVFISYPSFT